MPADTVLWKILYTKLVYEVSVKFISQGRDRCIWIYECSVVAEVRGWGWGGVRMLMIGKV
jgi:hypothetical protein